MRLTEKVHNFLKPILKADSKTIDGTVGNGHDTLFLAKNTPMGHCIGFDIQDEAIQQARKYLCEFEFSCQITLIQDNHSNMLKHIPPSWEHKVDAILFNLGYLPGGDKSKITQAQTTCHALESSLAFLSPRGALSVMVYPGHPGGLEEAEAVTQWAQQLGSKFKATFHTPFEQPSIGPEWLTIQKN